MRRADHTDIQTRCEWPARPWSVNYIIPPIREALEMSKATTLTVLLLTDLQLRLPNRFNLVSQDRAFALAT